MLHSNTDITANRGEEGVLRMRSFDPTLVKPIEGGDGCGVAAFWKIPGVTKLIIAGVIRRLPRGFPNRAIASEEAPSGAWHEMTKAISEGRRIEVPIGWAIEVGRRWVIKNNRKVSLRTVSLEALNTN